MPPVLPCVPESRRCGNSLPVPRLWADTTFSGYGVPFVDPRQDATSPDLSRKGQEVRPRSGVSDPPGVHLVC